MNRKTTIRDWYRVFMPADQLQHIVRFLARPDQRYRTVEDREFGSVCGCLSRMTGSRDKIPCQESSSVSAPYPRTGFEGGTPSPAATVIIIDVHSSTGPESWHQA